MDIKRLAGSKPGNYVIEFLLGGGGTCAVRTGRHMNLDRPVAPKLLPPHLSSDASFAKRMQKEARTIAGQHHMLVVGTPRR